MKRIFTWALLIAFAVSCLASSPALAHGHVQVGDYDLVIGFHNEPAVQGMPNTLDLFVTNTKTNEKVNGLESTLKAEVIFGSSKKVLKLEPQEGQEGAYTTYLIPAQAGDYTWHIFGTIQGAPVDFSMTSSPVTFGSVVPSSDYTFPTGKGVAVGGSNFLILIALIAGLLGAFLGLLGLFAGLFALQTVRRRG